MIQNDRKGTPTDADVDKIVSQLKSMAKNAAAPSEPSEVSLLGRLPSLPSPANPVYPSLSGSVTVGTDNDKGRKVLAREGIKVGEVVMVERPNTTFLCPNVAKVTGQKQNIYFYKWSYGVDITLAYIKSFHFPGEFLGFPWHFLGISLGSPQELW